MVLFEQGSVDRGMGKFVGGAVAWDWGWPDYGRWKFSLDSTPSDYDYIVTCFVVFLSN